ncbi:MAG: very-short-patch-repair endonuclease [Phenylobacterium sp.]|jgi:very-short-patch-repair endonuclease
MKLTVGDKMMEHNETMTRRNAAVAEISPPPVYTSNAELKLWEMMRNKQLNGFAFIRQVLVEPFIVDFACVELKVIVELDGGPNTEQQYYDLRRTEYLRKRGFVVLRFFNGEVLSSAASVVDTLRTTVATRAREVGH